MTSIPTSAPSCEHRIPCMWSSRHRARRTVACRARGVNRAGDPLRFRHPLHAGTLRLRLPPRASGLPVEEDAARVGDAVGTLSRP